MDPDAIGRPPIHSDSQGPVRLLVCPAGLITGLLPVVVVLLAAAAPLQAHPRGLYATRAEAERRASELRCQGVFPIGDRWMPCSSERELHQALHRSE